MQNLVQLIPIAHPPTEAIVGRGADIVKEGQKPSRYTLPKALESSSPVGYRTRISLTETEAAAIAPLLSLQPPADFEPPEAISEQELFEESCLGILSSRQSTNYRGLKQFTIGPRESQTLSGWLQEAGIESKANASHSHIVISKPYRTPFTFLLTFVGHKAFSSLWTVAQRAWHKKYHFVDDIPTIGYLQWLHLGILADSMERAAVIASAGRRRANVLLAPFCDDVAQKKNAVLIQKIEKLIGLTKTERAQGWRVRMITEVGFVQDDLNIRPELYRKIGANMLAFRSERIQPGVNQEAKAPPPYQVRQEMDVSPEFVENAGRSAYNAFHRWTGIERESCKAVLLNERVDVLTSGGKERLRDIRQQLNDITDKLIAHLPLWADLPMGRALSKNSERGRKAFALAGQRIYIMGLDRKDMQDENIPWNLGVMAAGAAAARSALYCELAGCINIPEGADMLAGICLMAGPVNQNDIGKQFYGYKDLLSGAHPQRDPTSLLVWTLKAKTVADPIGNEEQLLNAKRKGALVDLRCGPHELIQLKCGENWKAMRQDGETLNQERGFGDQSNFARSPDGIDITGNPGQPWPKTKSQEQLWVDELNELDDQELI